MEPVFYIAGEYRTGFPGVVADDDNIIKGLFDKLICILGITVTQVNPDFCHHPDSCRMNPVRWICPGRVYFQILIE
jgi:hypothetical protein